METRTKVILDLNLLLSDIRRYWKMLLGISMFSFAATLMWLYVVPRSVRPRPPSTSLPVLLSFIRSNAIEELLFRATLMEVLSRQEQRLRGTISYRRVIVFSALAFALTHVGFVITASSAWVRYWSVYNLIMAFAIGVFLGIVYLRSKNLLSVVVFHVWTNYQSSVLVRLLLMLVK